MDNDKLKADIIDSVAVAVKATEPMLATLIEKCGKRGFCFIPVVVVVVAGNK